MKNYLIISLLIVWSTLIQAQTKTETEQETGSISYITSQNVYVKFSSTAGLRVGDSLFMLENGSPKAVLEVTNVSSISCVSKPLSNKKLNVSDEVIFIHPKFPEPAVVSKEIAINPSLSETATVDTVSAKKEENKSKENIKGRLSTSAYFINSNQSPDYNLRMRYAFTLNASHINDSKVSVETYLLFSHKNKQWDLIKKNVFNGLKIYSLSVNYEFNENTQLWFGRRINRKLSSVGAIDGVQFENKFGNYTAGLIVGSRPNRFDYSLDAKLFQVGGYISHEYKASNSRGMQSTLSLMEQENNWNSDRRFLYFQHSNWLLKNLYLFGSGEFDLYKKVGEIKQNTFNLTNLYASIRYQVFKPLRVSLSYNSRNNIIYYETYKDVIDQMLDNETFQGFSLSANYRVAPKVLIGTRGSYRFRKKDARVTRNVYSYLTFTRLPFIKASATAYNTLVESSYIKSTIYGLRLSRDIVPGKLYGGLNYRYAKYAFYSAKSASVRNTVQFDLNYKIISKLSVSANYELSVEGIRNYNYIYLNISKRF